MRHFVKRAPSSFFILLYAELSAAQKADTDIIFNGVNGAGVLDYVTAWYIKAAKYMQEYNVIASN